MKVKKDDLKWSLEVVPSQSKNLEFLPNWIEEIYITMIPGSNIIDTIKFSKNILTMGKTPIPHISARSIESKKQFEEIQNELEFIGVKKILLIGGGTEKVSGPYTCVMDLLESESFYHNNFQEIGVAGHPEGNPDDPDSEKNLILKINWGKKNKLPMRIVTQWSFDSSEINKWVTKLRNLNIENPIHIGIPGPANLGTLLRYAQLCGVKASTQVLKKQGLSISKLLFINNPNKFIENLNEFQQLHLFPFGGLKKSNEWLKKFKKNI